MERVEVVRHALQEPGVVALTRKAEVAQQDYGDGPGLRDLFAKATPDGGLHLAGIRAQPRERAAWA